MIYTLGSEEHLRVSHWEQIIVYDNESIVVNIWGCQQGKQI